MMCCLFLICITTCFKERTSRLNNQPTKQNVRGNQMKFAKIYVLQRVWLRCFHPSLPKYEAAASILMLPQCSLWMNILQIRSWISKCLELNCLSFECQVANLNLISWFAFESQISNLTLIRVESDWPITWLHMTSTGRTHAYFEHFILNYFLSHWWVAEQEEAGCLPFCLDFSLE